VVLALLIGAAMSLAPSLARPAAAAGYRQTNLVTDPGSGLSARNTDAHLINAWGLTSSPSGPFWVANAESDSSTVYDGDGNPFPASSPLVVDTPPNPTGILYNGSNAFVISRGGRSAPARFLFATEGGTIAGWNQDVDATHALALVTRPNAVYKGLAGALVNGQPFLFAANFYHASIDVYDTAFRYRGSFVSQSLAAMGFAPFNIRVIGGTLVVTFAKQDADKHDDVRGAGNGFVQVLDVFSGNFSRFASDGPLNSPWGMTLAPSNFGAFSNAFLVGNFGDGTINAYNPSNGAFLGKLRDTSGAVIQIDGLWALRFGNGGQAGATNTLFFTAGPGDEEHGLFGKLEAVN